MKKERGEIIAFSKCLGYKYNYETKTMEINKEEAEIVGAGLASAQRKN